MKNQRKLKRKNLSNGGTVLAYKISMKRNFKMAENCKYLYHNLFKTNIFVNKMLPLFYFVSLFLRMSKQYNVRKKHKVVVDYDEMLLHKCIRFLKIRSRCMDNFRRF